MSRDCVFCRIVAGELPKSLVAENDLALAFLTIEPFNPGHTLIVSKRHAVTLTDLTPAEVASMAELAQRVAQALQGSGLAPDGFNLWMANGEAGEQTVFHAHMHVFPRFVGDHFKVEVTWPDTSRAELETVADRVRTALGQA